MNMSHVLHRVQKPRCRGPPAPGVGYGTNFMVPCAARVARKTGRFYERRSPMGCAMHSGDRGGREPGPGEHDGAAPHGRGGHDAIAHDGRLRCGCCAAPVGSRRCRDNLARVWGKPWPRLGRHHPSADDDGDTTADVNADTDPDADEDLHIHRDADPNADGDLCQHTNANSTLDGDRRCAQCHVGQHTNSDSTLDGDRHTDSGGDIHGRADNHRRLGNPLRLSLTATTTPTPNASQSTVPTATPLPSLGTFNPGDPISIVWQNLGQTIELAYWDAPDGVEVFDELPGDGNYGGGRCSNNVSGGNPLLASSSFPWAC